MRVEDLTKGNVYWYKYVQNIVKYEGNNKFTDITRDCIGGFILDPYSLRDLLIEKHIEPLSNLHQLLWNSTKGE